MEYDTAKRLCARFNVDYTDRSASCERPDVCALLLVCVVSLPFLAPTATGRAACRRPGTAEYLTHLGAAVPREPKRGRLQRSPISLESDTHENRSGVEQTRAQEVLVPGNPRIIPHVVCVYFIFGCIRDGGFTRGGRDPRGRLLCCLVYACLNGTRTVCVRKRY